MATSNEKVTFGKKELRGSRLRCLMFTAMPPNRSLVASRNWFNPTASLMPPEISGCRAASCIRMKPS